MLLVCVMNVQNTNRDLIILFCPLKIKVKVAVLSNTLRKDFILLVHYPHVNMLILFLLKSTNALPSLLQSDNPREVRATCPFNACQWGAQFLQPLYGDMSLSIGKSGQSTTKIIAAVTPTVDPHTGLSQGFALLCLLRPSYPGGLVALHTHTHNWRHTPGALVFYHVVLTGEHNGF